MNQKGFTLIELIVIIVILGILAVTAIPKYVDMKEDAENAAAQGVYGAAQGAASINFAANLLGTNPQPFIDSGTRLAGAMEGGLPENWTVHTDGTAGGIQTVGSTTTYKITIDIAETTNVKAVLSKSW